MHEELTPESAPLKQRPWTCTPTSTCIHHHTQRRVTHHTIVIACLGTGWEKFVMCGSRELTPPLCLWWSIFLPFASDVFCYCEKCWRKRKKSKKSTLLELHTAKHTWSFLTECCWYLTDKGWCIFWWDPKHEKRFKITLFIRTKHNMQIFGVIPFIKLQNDT